MNLLRQIQDDAVSGNVGIATVLRRCKVLAARLKSAPLEEWIRKESDGYPNGAELPHYRILPMRLLGHFSGPFGSGLRNAEIPISNIPEQLHDLCTKYLVTESISAIEGLLASHTGMLQVPISPDAVRFFADRVYRGMRCIGAWGILPQTSLVEIINHVRNKVLEFALNIEKLDPEAGEGERGTLRLSTTQVTNVFNTTIHGGSIGAVGNVDATNVIGSNVTKGDTASLRAALSAEGIDDADINDLEEALADEPTIPSDGSFQPKVQGWIGKMIGKAASGAWNVAVGAAASLLAGAIRAYYGLPS